MLGEMDLSGNMTRQIESDMPVQDDSNHIVNVGKLVEDMELKMRNLLRMYNMIMPYTVCAYSRVEEVYFGKAKDVVGDLRSKHVHVDHSRDTEFFVGIPPLTEANREKATHQEMINSIKRS